ncbi:hypothetical protein A3A95_03375 [Candidatus Nomurabacteria bacterium RIFCSPLOWO2_01_FULL_39_18]|uniref:Uncharacterized protein n=1 Tax=Candidatus Nomurabacteria bacterium RIFCSPHIGHO2_01_FULL_40_24b TaxID=1801739 RepID=A0A1F6V6N8_9BACT|nr:MAG: hypothetical protein A2647_05210 [Candidatus Nomurabacteria bacterium RIFCSPHIGHO2_01_FULL_40_24b]OGI89128.1 MAG: hypothetical protein A3A95_03375 [Candidatus Nomurabacteria bacterium RIFCSPLOWO2_01_FULL_39_18]
MKEELPKKIELNYSEFDEKIAMQESLLAEQRARLKEVLEDQIRNEAEIKNIQEGNLPPEERRAKLNSLMILKTELKFDVVFLEDVIQKKEIHIHRLEKNRQKHIEFLEGIETTGSVN